MLKLKIGQKSLLLFLIISLLPLAAVNAYWLRAEQATLRKTAEQRQSTLTSNAAEKVDQFINTKISTIILHSQTVSAQELRLEEAQKELLAFIYQDSDVERVALVDAQGQEKIAVNKDGNDPELKDVSGSDAFRAATFLSGKEYVGSVMFDEDQQPFVTIAVPMVSFETRQSLSNLSTAERGVIRNDEDIRGLLIVDVNLQNLWQSVLAAQLGDNGYAYLVDSRGRLIAHPDAELIKGQPNLSQNEEVAKFLKSPQQAGIPNATISEKGIEVLSTHQPVPRTGWAVVAQEPVDSIYQPANDVVKLTLLVFVAFAVASTLLSIVFSRNLTRPIRSLVRGTSQLGKGNLDMQIPVKSNDEIGVLASRFNKMADNLRELVGNLKTESTKLNVILNSVGDGIVAIDQDNRIISANVSAGVLTDALPSDIEGKFFEQTFMLSKNNQVFQIDTDKTEVYKDILLVSPNRRVHYLDVFVNKIEGDPSGINNIITLRDLTNDHELEMMKLDFVSMAAHELRTPVTAIRGYLGLLSKDDTSKLSAPAKRFVERAQSSTNQLVGLMSNLLNVSKIERGTLTMTFAKIDWAKVVQEAIRDNRFTAEEKSIELRYEGPEEGVPLLADEVAVQEVVNNLITNAIHYTDVKGHIVVGLQVKDDQVITYVKDDGMGIPKGSISRLFTKFYRVRGGIASGSGGTGLGLYISKSIVELHNGKIWVESEEGVGSTFIFSLPAFDEVQYQQATNKQEAGVKKHRGWVTKNIAR